MITRTNMIITTQVTEDYYSRTRPLFDSVRKYWDGRFVVGFIGFFPKDYTGEYYLMNKEDIFTYREGYPDNRASFVCPQGGEFIDYIDCQDDDVIIEIDADTIMQRKMSDSEMRVLTPKDNEILSVYSAMPPMSLYDVSKNLNFVGPDRFSDLNDTYEFTGSILVANRNTFVKLRDRIISEWDEFITINRHHAGIQWLISKISREHLNVRILDNVYQCGNWYQTFNTSVRDYKLYYNDTIVIFNHTKFNDQPFRNPCDNDN